MDDLANLFVSEENEGLRGYMERLRDILESGDFNPFQGVTANEQYAVIVLSLEDPTLSSYRDLLVKDLRSGKLLPLIVRGTSGEVALEGEDGAAFFYVACDSLDGRPNRVRRFSIESG